MNDNIILNEFKLNPILSTLTKYEVDKNLFLDSNEYPIYSNKNIEDIVYKICQNSNTTNDILNVIKNGLDFRKITVGYTNPSSFSFLYNRILNIVGLKSDYTLAYFDPYSVSIKIILDDNIDLFGNDIEKIDNIIAHELCHMAAYKESQTNIINASFNSILKPYYKNLIIMAHKYLVKNELIYNTKFIINDDKLKTHIMNIVNNVEIKKLDIFQKVKIAFKLWLEYFINILNFKEDDAQILTQFLFSPYIIDYMNDIGHNIKIMPKIKKLKTDASSVIYFSYSKIGITNKTHGTLPGQELIFISEVIAISNQYGISPVVKNCINKIKY